MRRTGRVILIFLIIIASMTGLWMFQGWQEMRKEETKKTVHNVYISKIEGTTLYGIDGEEKTWELASVVDDKVASGIADLVIVDGQVATIQKKPDMLQGKILKIDEDKIQVEEYGEVELDSYFRLYHRTADGTISPGVKEELIVGDADIEYIVAGKKICAAIVGENKLAKIRVILTNGADNGYDYSQIKLSATSACEMTTDGKTVSYPAGSSITLRPQDVTSRVVIDTKGKGKLRLENGKSNYGVPEYRGLFEVEKSDKSLRIINEVSLEEYLYSVVPSEMPTEYPKEALKAQAICARSYAVQQMKGRRLAKYGAHVDDSVSFQVYNNLREDEDSIQAVNETRDYVVAKNGKVVTAYFYSVSCGCSEGTKDIWFAKKDEEHLPVRWQKENGGVAKLQDEKQFAAYIKGQEKSYDELSPWYRWQTTVSVSQLQKNIESRAKIRYKNNPTQIQTKQKDGTYRSTGEVELGEWKNMKIVSRGQGGVARILEIEGSKNTIQVYTEYNIRYLLGDDKGVYKQANKKEVTGLSLLPSGFFVIDKKKDTYVFQGGGYGHGVGMSQFGAKTMAEQGKKVQDILTFYFPGTTSAKREAL